MHTGVRQLLQHDGRVGERAAATAVRLGQVGEQHADPPGLRPRFRIGTLLLAPAGLVRHELLLNELTNRLAEHLHLVVRPRGLVGSRSHYSL